MGYKLEDLIDIQQFQALQDRLNEIYSFPSAIIDNEGNILTATAWQDVCTVFHRKNPLCEKDCQKSDQYILDHLNEANPAMTYRCPRGLVDNATPIIIDGIHYGNYFTGQFFMESPDIDFFRKQAQDFGFDVDSYLEAVKKVPVWSQKQLDSYLFFIKGLIEVISTSGIKKLQEIEARNKAEKSEQRAAAILNQMSDGFWMVDRQGGKIHDVNEAMCQMLGYTREELLRMSVADVEANDLPEVIEQRINQVLQNGSVKFESRHRCKDGWVIDVEISVNYIPSLDMMFALHRDITERKRSENAMRRLNRELRSISDCNQVLVRAENEQDLLQEICQIICTEAGYRMAWVGYAELDEKKTVRPVAWAGIEDGYLSQTWMTWGDSELGYGAAGTSIRTGEMIHIRNFSSDPFPGLWKEEAAKRDYQSGIFLPLKAEDKHTFGTLGIYAAMPNAFGPDEIRLLDELAGDLAFGIVVLRARAEQKRTAELLQKSEKRFRQLFEAHNTVMLLVDPESREIVDANPAAVSYYGYDRSQLQGMNLTNINPQSPEEIAVNMHKVKNREREKFNVQHRRADGEVRTVEIRSSPIDTGERQLLFSIIQDISERKRSEKMMQMRLELMEFSVAHPLDQVLQKTLDLVGELTNSPIGFYHFVDYDQQNLTLQAWSTRTTREYCSIHAAGAHYPIDQAGVWVDSVIMKKPVIHNDYNSLPHRKDLPEGHASLIRELVVPILREDKVVALLGVGNKPGDYTDEDVNITLNFADMAWEVAVRKRAEEELNLRLSFETMLADIQANLLMADAHQIDDAIRHAQQQVCGFLGMERSSIWLGSETEPQQLKFNFRFGANEDVPFPENATANKLFPWATQQLLNGRSVFAHNITELPSEASTDRENGSLLGIKSFLVIPLTIGESLIAGAISFTSIQQSIEWSERLLAQCKMVVQVLASALARKRAEMKLRANEARFRAVVENSFDGMILLSAERKLVFISPSYMRINGYTSEEILGGYGAEFNHPDDRALTAKIFNETLLHPGKPFLLEYRVRHKNGSWVWVETVATNLLNDPDIRAVVLNSRDISERKQRQNELQAIVSLSSALRTAQTREAMLPIIIQQVANLTNYDAITIEMIDPANGDVVVEAGYGLWEILLGMRQPKGVGINAIISETLQPYRSQILESDPNQPYPLWAHRGIRGAAGVPLIAQEMLIGFIWGGSAKEVTDVDIRLLSAIGDIAANAIHRASLHEQTQQDAENLALAYDTTLEGWVHALELRDQETQGHSKRVVETTVDLARALGFSQEDLEHIRRGALLHDIGKMGIPDSVLLKPGTLNDREWEVMRRHPEYAYEMLKHIEYLHPALDIPYCHHEKWDGSGYPRRLKGQDIPLSARIFAVVDVWDALITNRPYRQAWAKEQALEYMRNQSGRHFDPNVLYFFLKMIED